MSAVDTGARSGRAPSRLASGKVARTESKQAMKTVTPRHKRSSVTLGILMTLMLLYCLVPLWWLVVNSTKTMDSLYNSFAFWFSGEFALFQNIVDTFTYKDGIFLRWLGNTLVYVVIGAGGATLLATLAGYGLAKYNFPGRKWVFAIIPVSYTHLTLPTN